MSYRSLHIAAAGLAAIGVAPVATAQALPSATPAQATAPGGGRVPQPVTRTNFIRDLDANYKRLDANNDGGVTQAEIKVAQDRAEQAIDAMLTKRRAEMFAKLDTNKDGQLNTAEFNAGAPIPQRPKADPAEALTKMDSNKDQKLSAAEFRAPALAGFDKVDLNRDGTVSIDEQKKARPAAK